MIQKENCKNDVIKNFVSALGLSGLVCCDLWKRRRDEI